MSVPEPQAEALMKAFAAGPEQFMEAFVEAVRREFIPDDAILKRATFRWEYRKCRSGKAGWFSDCKRCRERMYCQGPYLYLYWKEKGKLRKKYLGKGPTDYLSKKVEKCYSQGNGLE